MSDCATAVWGDHAQRRELMEALADAPDDDDEDEDEDEEEAEEERRLGEPPHRR